MARSIKPEAAKALLAELFSQAEEDYRSGASLEIPEQVCSAIERLFASETQAYREALAGCAVARILDPEIDVRLPATDDGATAFSGRSLADHAITPFLRARAIPISASPYLSALRGGARFVAGGEPRIQRDKPGFDALVAAVAYLHSLGHEKANTFLRYLLRRFIQLRESVNIALKRIARPNLRQLNSLINGLLAVKSGGRFPAFLATAMFQTLSECHNLGWTVEFQGINVADKASGAVGDIAIHKDGLIILGIEVTERPIDKGRVTLTFNQKMQPGGLVDYLFVTTARPEADALAAARSYTEVGHEMNFVQLAEWLTNNLATIGPACRALFQTKIIGLVGSAGVSAGLKVAWNEKMDLAIGV